MTDVYQQGFEAFRAGKTEEHNPYVVGGDVARFMDWKRGFYDARLFDCLHDSNVFWPSGD